MIFVNPYAKLNPFLPNFSLIYAATHFNTKVIDLNTKIGPKKRFLQNTDILGISIQSRTSQEAARLIKEYKGKFPNVKISSVNTGIDIQCCYPFLKLKDDLNFNEPFSDKYPFPNYELLDSFPIFQKNWQTGKWNYPILTSLGCPFQCTYCAAKNRKWNSRSPENCYEELKQAKQKWNIKYFEILDDVFNINKARVLKFCELIKNLGIKWRCVNGLRADLFDEEIAQAMAESNCDLVGFGVESIDPEILKIIKKGETIEQIEKAVIIARKYFKMVNCYFIIGLPGSNYEKDLKSLEWARKMKINATFSYYVPPEKQAGAVFYGEGAKSFSQEYDQKLQDKIYNMTAYMRPEKNIIRRALNKVRKEYFKRF